MILRSLPSESGKVFLTFDDGPCPVGTEAVLDVLREKNAGATFFLVAEKLKGRDGLVRRIQSEGHAIGDHSLDHRYNHFFTRGEKMREWLEDSQAEFRRQGIFGSVGFRPPAGVLTPSLIENAAKMGLPIILWNTRFFDTLLPWNKARARDSGRKISAGSIVLLHDRQSPSRIEAFCESLGVFIDEVQARGLRLSPLSKPLTLSVNSTSRIETVLV